MLGDVHVTVIIQLITMQFYLLSYIPSELVRVKDKNIAICK